MIVDPKVVEYFQVVSTYIHLNPVRAGLVAAGRNRLKQYRWSSYPRYLTRRGPVWLRRDRVMGSLRLKAGQVRGYEAYLESRVLEWGMKNKRVGPRK